MPPRRSFAPQHGLGTVRADERSGSSAQTARHLGVRPALVHRRERELCDDGRTALFGYLAFCNHRRRPSALGYPSPTG